MRIEQNGQITLLGAIYLGCAGVLLFFFVCAMGWGISSSFKQCDKWAESRTAELSEAYGFGEEEVFQTKTEMVRSKSVLNRQ